MVERFADPILLPESAGVPAESFIILSQTNGQASFVDPSVRLLDYLPFNAEWQSPSLNRSDQRADMTLSTVTLYYFAEEETDMEVPRESIRKNRSGEIEGRIIFCHNEKRESTKKR